MQKALRLLSAMTALSFLFFDCESASAELASGASIVAEKENSDTSGVIGVYKTTDVFVEPDDESESFYRIMKNQIIRQDGSAGDFYKVSIGKKTGWVRKADCFAGDELTAWIVQNSNWFVRTAVAKTDTVAYDWITGNVFCNVKSGDEFQIKSVEDDFLVVIYTEVSSTGEELNTLINVPKDDFRVTCQITVSDYSDVNDVSTVNDDMLDLVEYACSFVGSEYVWGGTDPNTGVDCSGFVKYVYEHFGYNLPRCSWQQATAGKEVSLDDLKPGDLVFYQRGSKIGHVAIYIGNGQCVHARSRSYGVCVTEMDYSQPLCATRIIGEVENE